MHDRRHYYLNALFDLELGGYPVESVKRSAAEMTVLFIPLMQPGDTVELDIELPDSYLTYLQSFGLGPGDLSKRTKDATAVVWGWNREAVKRLSVVNEEEVPSLETVRDINNRRFCREVTGVYGFGVPGSRFCSTMEEVRSAVTLLADAGQFPLVVKPAFGGAGFGLRILRHNEQLADEYAVIINHLRHGGVVIEPWRSRVADLSTAIPVDRGGTLGPVRFERQWVNSYGASFGIFCAEADPLIEKWKGELARTTLVLAREVALRGYFGPIGFDSFVYRDRSGEERLAAGIEINARFTMGLLAQLLRERIAPEKHTLLRFIGRKKCRLPDTFTEWTSLCGEDAFDSTTQSGIIMLTPLHAGYRGTWVQPQRSAFFLAGDTDAAITRLDEELRRRVA
jgi:hypothetical protein